MNISANLCPGQNHIITAFSRFSLLSCKLHQNMIDYINEWKNCGSFCMLKALNVKLQAKCEEIFYNDATHHHDRMNKLPCYTRWHYLMLNKMR